MKQHDTEEQRSVHSHSNRVEQYSNFTNKGLPRSPLPPECLPSSRATVPPHTRTHTAGRSSLLLMEQRWRRLAAGLSHDLHGLVVQGSLTHLSVHELVLVEQAQLHLCLRPHGLWDTDTPGIVMTSPTTGWPWALLEKAGNGLNDSQSPRFNCAPSEDTSIGGLRSWPLASLLRSQTPERVAEGLFSGTTQWGSRFEPWPLHLGPTLCKENPFSPRFPRT